MTPASEDGVTSLLPWHGSTLVVLLSLALAANNALPGRCTSTQSHAFSFPPTFEEGTLICSACQCRYYRGRGAFESLGAGLHMDPGDIA